MLQVDRLHAAPRLLWIDSAALAVDPEQLVYKRPSYELQTTLWCLDLTVAGEARSRTEGIRVCKDRIRKNSGSFMVQCAL
jgi:hypothetical protein